MQIITTSLLGAAYNVVNSGQIFFDWDTAKFTDEEIYTLFEAIEKGWPIGLITAVRVDETTIRVVHGQNILAPLSLALTGEIPIIRTFDIYDGKYTKEDVPGFPISLTKSEEDFLNWAQSSNLTTVQILAAQTIVRKIQDYEIPIVVVKEDSLALRSYLKK